jgi:hypothetical protein
MNTTVATKTTARRTLSASEIISSIEAAALPAPTGDAIRTLGTVEQCSKIRAMLKAAGIKGVSVKRSHAGWSATVAVSFLRLGHEEGVNWGLHNRAECPICSREIAATRKLETVILAAFPDCDNRSDSMTDYFDYVFGVSAVHGRE